MRSFLIEAYTPSGTSWKGGKPMNTTFKRALWVGLLMLDSGMMRAEILPGTPTKLFASAVSPFQINLNWRENRNQSERIMRGNVFNIERCSGQGCENFAEVAQVSREGDWRGEFVTYSNTGLTPNTTYRYRVRASRRSGESSPYSNTAEARTLPPAPPDLVVKIFPNVVVHNCETVLVECYCSQPPSCPMGCPSQGRSIFIKNQGDLSPSGQVTFTIKTLSQVLHTWTVPIPAAGQSSLIGSIKQPYPCDDGVIHVNPSPNLFFIVDSQNVLAEGNEQNNTVAWFTEQLHELTFAPVTGVN